MASVHGVTSVGVDACVRVSVLPLSMPSIARVADENGGNGLICPYQTSCAIATFGPVSAGVEERSKRSVARDALSTWSPTPLSELMREATATTSPNVGVSGE